MNKETETNDKIQTPVKRVMICCNGFINTKNHPLSEFKNYFDSINSDPNKTVVTINLYDPADKKTFKRKKQYNVLIEEVQRYAKENYIIYLLGYSYTCGISARISTMFPQVKKLILISPTLYLLKTKLLFSYLKTAFKYIKLRCSHPNKSKKTMSKLNKRGTIPLSYNVAKTIFKDRKYFKKVHCRVFVGKAQDDELCVGKTLWKITHKLEQNRVTLKSYPSGGHTMIMHQDRAQTCFDDILSFAFHIKNAQDQRDEEEEKLSTLSFDPLKVDEVSYFKTKK